MTIYELYQYAVKHGKEHAELRICDGMAVSYYPTGKCVGLAPNEVVLDVSPIEPIDYDELTPSSQRVSFADDWYWQP